jgi:hypothetical protein
VRKSIGVLAAFFALFVVGAAWAAYWDYQGWLPDSSGKRIYVKYNNVGIGYQPIRMSWTVGSHCMRFIRIPPDGSWHGYPVCVDYPGCDGYDCRVVWLSESYYDKFGCWNPPNLPTVWVNCRATYPL